MEIRSKEGEACHERLPRLAPGEEDNGLAHTPHVHAVALKAELTRQANGLALPILKEACGGGHARSIYEQYIRRKRNFTRPWQVRILLRCWSRH